MRKIGASLSVCIYVFNRVCMCLYVYVSVRGSVKAGKYPRRLFIVRPSRTECSSFFLSLFPSFLLCLSFISSIPRITIIIIIIININIIIIILLRVSLFLSLPPARRITSQL